MTDRCYITDQLTDFTGKVSTSLDSRLTSLDLKMAGMDKSLADLVVRAHAWDSFQHHIQAWNSQLTTLDQKVDLMGR